MKTPERAIAPTLLGTFATYVVLLPFVTWLLIWLRGLPAFAGDHPMETLLWVYQATVIPSCLGGLFIALLLFALRRRLDFFTDPYDIGRCASFGAIAGSLAQAVSTWIYRTITHHLFSNFWIAGALIAGCLTDAVVMTVHLWIYSRQKTHLH